MPTNSSASRIPMYFRIQQNILEQIQNGSLKPAQQLPTEIELAQQYQVSRITAKRALDELVRQGRAFRQRGRGTFVAQTQIRDISGFGSFSEDMRARGLVPGAQVLTFKEVEPDLEIQTRLQLTQDEHVYQLKRLRLANDEPVAVEMAYLPCRLCPGLINEDFNNRSLYAILAEKYQIVPTWADAEFEARMATKEEAFLLKLEVGKPVLSARRVTFSANYDVIEAVNSVYRGDRFTFYSGRQLIG
jgi:GntR family transcriptional regulator